MNFLKKSLDNLIKKTSTYKKLDRLSEEKTEKIKELNSLLRNNRTEDNTWYQRYIALSILMEGKTGSVFLGKENKCPLCNLDRRLYGIPANVLDYLSEKHT